MGNSIGLRRDMISSLEFKTKKYIDEAVPSDTNWPKVFETDEVMTEASPYLAKYKSNDGLKWLQAHNASLLEQYQQEHTLDDAEFQEKFIDILPKNWTVCSLSLDPETGEIYAVQLRQKQAPLVFKIPINRMESNASFKYEDAVAEMKNIIAESDVTIEASRSCVENTDVEKWWSTRNELDERLRKLLASIENQWLGGFKVNKIEMRKKKSVHFVRN
jgi:separase